MAGSTVPPRRASDADRDGVVTLLREAAVDGRLTHDSFVRRVDLALRAKDRHSLDELVVDVRPPRPAARGGRSSRPSALPTLSLPDRRRPVLTIGRRSDCDVVVRDETVSRVHAVLMLFAGVCFIDDRASTNGTRVNGRRIWGATELRPGDRVGLGRVTFRVVPMAEG